MPCDKSRKNTVGLDCVGTRSGHTMNQLRGFCKLKCGAIRADNIVDLKSRRKVGGAAGFLPLQVEPAPSTLHPLASIEDTREDSSDCSPINNAHSCYGKSFPAQEAVRLRLSL